ncbi:MAG: divergent PAP2 family protein [Armatimonadetes bacterium]|nr:divergent PAP2 family protein [Armatimonadota bacterium]
MNTFHQVTHNQPLVSAFAAWASAQVIKVILFSVLERRFSWRKLMQTGGLPSAHSAFVVGLALGVGFKDGFAATTFAIATVLALVVMYDALSIRREAGKHADILNDMLLLSFIQDAFKEREALRELLGHTPLEVFAGALIGIGASIIVNGQFV